MPLQLKPTFAALLSEAKRPLIGMWVCSGSAVVAEIAAGSGLDYLLIDMEHSPNTLTTVLAQLQAAAAYPITTVVRVPVADPVIIKQVLELGAQNLLVPMVNSAAEAQAVVQAARYPPGGMRGVGAALGRSARWGRVPGYVTDGDAQVSVIVQIESAQAVVAAGEIAAVDGVDAVFVGPSDLAASMGHLGSQSAPEVTAAARTAFDAARAVGKPVGVNAFDPAVAQGYLDAGASFVLVDADVSMLARGSDALTARWIGTAGSGESY